MNSALETLFLAPRPSVDVTFLNAQYHPALEEMKSGLVLQQHFKPYADILASRGFLSDPLDVPAKSACVLMLLPKNAIEAQGLIARGLYFLEPGGAIICAAANDAGGTRIKKMLQKFGLNDVHELSKNKARVAWAVTSSIDDMALKHAIAEAGMQPVMNDTFHSMPGLFGWDKVDIGSALLAEHLPSLNGHGADFGCGYGWLARHVLERGKDIRINCIDADARALEACKINLKNNLKNHGDAEFSWMDLTAGSVQNLDWIVMNPPFHEGKATGNAIGRQFISNAARSLKSGGQLWMVANVHLPYEKDLKELFSDHTKIYEGRGFKIFHAVK